MDKSKARELKAQVLDYARELAGRTVHPAEVRAADTAHEPVLFVGLAPQPDGSYALAVRYRLGVPSVRSIARKVAEQVGPTVDVRRTGRIRTLATTGTPTGRSADGADRVRPRPPVITARSLGETGRVRPLRPGVSIAHHAVTAGTLGAFVEVGGAVHALSNYHVLSGTPKARVGDVVLQPGPADGGREPRDRVGTLAARVELAPGSTARVDAAIALLDDPVVDPTYPVGRITTTAAAVGGEVVGKIGRTTAVTRGRVSAIEVDGVVVGYGRQLGELSFDDQIEVEGFDAEPFSRGGDSGSLVYREDGVAIGLLFAGSETGGDNGTGLTYLNPIDAVLDAFGATFVR
ncbi:hypothetical protein Cch01nite_26400 [Cellulomonas chitinilytica]|uniref:Serine protease n=1 Tax=Cellulomonas chitinilytica TaxID=398759 RepID=A0A919P5C5_9CELL|nr:hypothetical protein [Cellulomonas chitinilytica]GIG21916.1 hypothetical protein Cch01nite_26400 [Cellulomonas chitinilytica]